MGRGDKLSDFTLRQMPTGSTTKKTVFNRHFVSLTL